MFLFLCGSSMTQDSGFTRPNLSQDMSWIGFGKEYRFFGKSRQRLGTPMVFDEASGSHMSSRVDLAAGRPPFP
jgi:hypothetical protein